MSLLSKATFAAVPKPLLWLAGILLLTTLAGAGTTWYYRGELQDAETLAKSVKDQHEAELSAKVTRIGELEAANAHEQAVVQELARRLVTAVGQHQQAQEALDDAIQQRDRAHRERDRARTEARKAQEAIYANDEACAEWGARPVCGRISDGVWEQWERARGAAPAGQDGAGGDAGAATGEDRPDAHRGAQAAGRAHAGYPLRPAGMHAPGRLLLEPAAAGDARRIAVLGKRHGGQPQGDPPRQRRGHETARGHARETAVTLIVLEYPDDASAARIFDDLHRAGALNRSHFTPAVTVIASTTAPGIADQLRKRMREKGLSGLSDLTVQRSGDRAQGEA